MDSVVDVKTGPDQSFEDWSSFNNSLASGPEVLGFYDEKEYERICADETTVFVDGPNGKRPLLVPVRNHPDLNESYFSDPDNFDQSETIYYLFPTGDVTAEGLEKTREVLSAEIEKGASFFVQYEATDVTTQNYLRSLLPDFEESHLVDKKNGSDTSVFHFIARANYAEPVEPVSVDRQDLHGQELYRQQIFAGEKDGLPENGTTVLMPELLVDENGLETPLVYQLWNMYNRQMDILIENHPRYQRFHRDDFVELLMAEDSINIVNFEDGVPVIAYMSVTNISEHATWLETEAVLEYAGKDIDVMYCSGMFVDFDRQGEDKAREIFKTISEIIADRGREYAIYFECTNISATYVPRVSLRAFEEATEETANPTVETVANYVQAVYKKSTN